MIPALAQAFVDSEFLVFMDNGKVPRTPHDYGYARKIGAVQHIPVCDTLEQLDNYFCGGSALGSSTFGVGREQVGELVVDGLHIPVARVSQYLPLRGVSPWAQGIIQKPTATIVEGMRPGEPNGAFFSWENVARTGAQGMTDAQFNSNVLTCAYCAGLDGYPVDADHDLGHFEIDSVNRPEDPGWSGALWQERQDAINKLLRNDPSGLRSTHQDDSAPPAEEPIESIRLEAAQPVIEWTDDDAVRAVQLRIVRDKPNVNPMDSIRLEAVGDPIIEWTDDPAVRRVTLEVRIIQ